MIREDYPKLFKILKKLYVPFKSLKKLKYFVDYLVCIIANKPYFGHFMIAGITWDSRKDYMKKSMRLASKDFNGSFFRVAEIGSWAGGSAVLWADSLKQLNMEGLVCCIDSWTSFDEPEKDGGVSRETLLEMKKAFKNDRIYRLFLHNIKTTRHEDIIKPYRGTSNEILPTLMDEAFNLIYIDASHIYSQVIEDLKNSSRLVAPGGFLCGDDLELQLHEVEEKSALENKENDFILDKKTGKLFHPGVACAVADFFSGRVTSYSGFWIMQKTSSGWKDVIL
jgi:hypothetical protein